MDKWKKSYYNFTKIVALNMGINESLKYFSNIDLKYARIKAERIQEQVQIDEKIRTKVLAQKLYRLPFNNYKPRNNTHVFTLDFNKYENLIDILYLEEHGNLCISCFLFDGASASIQRNHDDEPYKYRVYINNKNKESAHNFIRALGLKNGPEENV